MRARQNGCFITGETVDKNQAVISLSSQLGSLAGKCPIDPENKYTMTKIYLKFVCDVC